VSARTTALIVERELREAARRKSVWALVGLTFLGSLAVVVLPEVIPSDDSATVAIVGDDTIGLADALAAVSDSDIEVEEVADRDTAATAVTDGEVDLAVVLGEPPSLVVDEETSSLVTLVREIVTTLAATQAMTDAGIDPEAVSAAFTAAAPTIDLVDQERESRRGAAFVVTVVLYLVIIILTSQVASAVAVEKSNRVSEVLLAIVPPRSMLYGKVIGVASIGVVTLLAGIAPVAARYALGGDLPEQLLSTLAASGLWFVGGLALYLTMAGGLGATVARQEEVGAVVTPLTMLLVAGYLASLTASDSPVGVVLAYVPLTSPLVEPYRIAIGEGSWPEYVISLLILAITVVLVGRLSATVFRRAIVHTGRRLRFRDVLAR
jgi:ABC-2 type transport system permease protein